MFEFSSLYCRLIGRAVFTFSLCSQSGSTEVLRPLRVWHSWSKRTARAKSSPEKMFLHCLTVWLTKQKCPLDRAGADSGQWLVTASYAHMHLLSFATTSTMQKVNYKERRDACEAKQNPRGIHRHLCPHSNLNWACGVLLAVWYHGEIIQRQNSAANHAASAVLLFRFSFLNVSGQQWGNLQRKVSALLCITSSCLYPPYISLSHARCLMQISFPCIEMISQMSVPAHWLPAWSSLHQVAEDLCLLVLPTQACKAVQIGFLTSVGRTADKKS